MLKYTPLYCSTAPNSAELPSSWEFVFTFYFVLSVFFLSTELIAAVLQHHVCCSPPEGR